MSNTVNQKMVLPSGMTCYILPKDGYVEKQAAVVIGYGSADLRFGRSTDVNANANANTNTNANANTKTTTVMTETPQGTAHFLEHKLFESEEENIFQAFIRNGATVNAFTNVTSTCYYFSCIDHFTVNLRRLLKQVTSPHFTDENVEKEKGIINQEIAMYQDDPQWRLYINLQKTLFGPIGTLFDIAGSEASIAGITKELLYHCYETFYTPSNMALICAGAMDKAEIDEIMEIAKTVEMAGAAFSHKACKSTPVIRAYGHTPPAAASRYTEAWMPISMPMFQIGFKDNLAENDQTVSVDATANDSTVSADAVTCHYGRERGRLTAVSRLLADIVAGESSPLQEALYDEGLIDNHFAVAYIGGAFHGTSLFAGNSTHPLQVEKQLVAEIARLKKDGIPTARFEIIKEKAIGRFIRSQNSLDALVTAQAELHSIGLTVDDMLTLYKNITLSDVTARLHAHLRDDNRALSVVWPNNKQET